MKMTRRGMLALALHEGLVPAPYKDVKGIWTYGIGHTAEAGAPDPEKMPRGVPADLDAAIRDVLVLFARDVVRYEAEVLRAVRVPLVARQFDALVSFHYNTGAIAEAALTRHLNAGNPGAAAAAFMNWVTPSSLRPRRTAEMRLFRDGVYPTGAIPVWGVTAAGQIDWRKPIRQLVDPQF